MLMYKKYIWKTYKQFMVKYTYNLALVEKNKAWELNVKLVNLVLYSAILHYPHYPLALSYAI